MNQETKIGVEVIWHAEAISDVLRLVDSSPDGLTGEEARRRLESGGPNELPHAPRVPLWKVFLRQFNNPLIYILLIAAGVALVLRDFTDAGFIFGVLVINATIGGLQEYKAEQANRALQQLIVTIAAAVRGGEVVEIPARELVPGDIVMLESGNRVPADLRLLSAHDLEVDESLLTGESLSVSKDPDWSRIREASLGDRRNMCYAGAVVARGRGRGVVVDTGSTTMVGRLALDVTGHAAGKPPLLQRLERFTRVIGVVVLVVVAVIGLIGVLVQHRPPAETFMFAIALAVSAIPEGLPIALTVALAVATARMAKRGVVVRRLAAVEGLGSCTLVASDKTGTLTANQLTVQVAAPAEGDELQVTGVGYDPEGTVGGGRPGQLEELARCGVLCNEASLRRSGEEWVHHGDPTEVALLAFGQKVLGSITAERSEYKLVNEIPFEAEWRYAATWHRDPEGRILCSVKGAPERVIDMCEWSDDESRNGASDQAASLATRGYRVLGLAAGTDMVVREAGTPEEPSGLHFLGLVGMIDPLRTGVKEAVQDCRKAGIDVSMVTGDHPVTAFAIAKELGFATERSQVVTGRDLEAMSDDELGVSVVRTRVYARTSPDQKLRIVNAAKSAGQFVAVTGDGVNDAPALRAANIGVAMGKSGTDVAREAAELVITDDNFATIVSGVEEGRVAYDNVRKVIYLLISTGAGEVVLVLLSVIANSPIPLLPVQLLWLNLVTNGIQDVALAFEPREGDVLNRPPRSPRERIFNRLMIERTVLAAMVMGGVGFFWFQHLLNQGFPENEARNALLLLFVLFENVHVGNSRSETRSMFLINPLTNRLLIGSVVAALLVHVSMMYVPFGQTLLGTSPVSAGIWLQTALLALTLALVMEVHKLWLKLHPGEERGKSSRR